MDDYLAIIERELSAIETLAFRIPPPCQEVPEIVSRVIRARHALYHADFMRPKPDSDMKMVGDAGIEPATFPV